MVLAESIRNVSDLEPAMWTKLSLRPLVCSPKRIVVLDEPCPWDTDRHRPKKVFKITWLFLAVKFFLPLPAGGNIGEFCALWIGLWSGSEAPVVRPVTAKTGFRNMEYLWLILKKKKRKHIFAHLVIQMSKNHLLEISACSFHKPINYLFHVTDFLKAAGTSS